MRWQAFGGGIRQLFDSMISQVGVVDHHRDGLLLWLRHHTAAYDYITLVEADSTHNCRFRTFDELSGMRQLGCPARLMRGLPRDNPWRRVNERYLVRIGQIEPGFIFEYKGGHYRITHPYRAPDWVVTNEAGDQALIRESTIKEAVAEQVWREYERLHRAVSHG